MWRAIWKLQIPGRGKKFLWRACHNILPTQENLRRHKIYLDLACPVCGLEEEIAIHILWQCSSARDVWSAGTLTFLKCTITALSFLQLVEGMLNRCSPDEFMQFVGTARRIWLHRNEVIQGGHFTHPNEVVKQTLVSVEEL